MLYKNVMNCLIYGRSSLEKPEIEIGTLRPKLI